MNLNKNRIISGLVVITVTILVIAMFFGNIIKNTKLGLDLQGGIEILYKVEAVDGDGVNQELMDSTIDILDKRINTFGISETVIAQEGDNMIRIQIPGVDDQSSARELLGSSAVLSFRNSEDEFLMGAEVLRPGKAKLTTNPTGGYAVQLSINEPDKMKEVTGKLVNSADPMMVIWLDFDEEEDSYASESLSCGSSGSNCISAAVVRSQLSNEAVISGNFTEDEASTLVGLLNSGSLQVNLIEEYSTSVGASFGAEALNNSIIASVVGLGLVMLFMIYRYRFSGLISSFSLLFYSFCVFVVFYIFGGVLTLPGIAALVLGIGMAIDANVISFERVKEEYAKTNNLRESFIFGNKKSVVTIIDANVTTALVAIVLYTFGETAIKGFATMLLINIAITLLVTVLFTRFVLRFFIDSNYFENKPKAYMNYNENSKITNKLKEISYVNKNKVFFSISLAIIVAGLTFGAVKGYNVGIDFSSGTSIISSIEEKEYRELDEYMSDKYDVVDSKYVNDDNLAVIRLSDALNDSEIIEVTKYVDEQFEGETNIQKVSPLVGEKLLKNSVYSLLIAGVAIIIYISIRFRGSFAIASIVALLHDLFIMLALFAILRFTLSGDFVAALLAIIGYSINDTIVLFDRVRDNINNDVETLTKPSKKKGKKNQEKVSGIIEYDRLKEIVDTSVRETIGRSITTSFTTLIPIVSLIILGAVEILEFNFALAIGILFGTYSSIFIAAQVWLALSKKGYHYGEKEDGWFAVEDSKEKYID